MKGIVFWFVHRDIPADTFCDEGIAKSIIRERVNKFSVPASDISIQQQQYSTTPLSRTSYKPLSAL